MKTGYQVCIERGMREGQEIYNSEEFAAAGLPMVVACTGCQKTMCIMSPSVLVEEEAPGLVWCADCAPEEE